MKKIMHILFLSCLRATELIEKKFQAKLSITEILQLKMHKMMCNACANYEKHSTLIESALNFEPTQTEPAFDFKELKTQIIKELNKTQ